MLKRVAWYWGKRGVEAKAKEGELSVGPEVIAQLQLRGRATTGDALYAQKGLSRQVVEQGGDYFWVVKRNQPTLYEDIALLYAQPPWGERWAEACQGGRHGDRREWRRLRASSALKDYLDWPHIEQVCCIEGEVSRRKGETKRETSYAITSLGRTKASAQELVDLWRGHWRIENRLHWVRDESLGEDASQVRTGAAPEVMAAIGNVVLSLLRWAGASNIAAARRHYSWKATEALALIGLGLL
jgi:predicted transposase YbfD/YdcC